MAIFGDDPRDSEIAFLRDLVKELQKQLVNLADPLAHARLNPPQARPPLPGPDNVRRMPVGQLKQVMADRPVETDREAAEKGHERAAALEQRFRDTRQP